MYSPLDVTFWRIYGRLVDSDEDYGARVRLRREHEQDYPENEKEGILRGYTNRDEVVANKFRRCPGGRESPPLFGYACMLQAAFRLCYNNNGNCDVRRIMRTTITMLNRNIRVAENP